ncbi:MAG: metallopeptidase TldD-related protein [Deltaproteobacteria bacterium]|nr:metallopeptidase TldD-related protein [Deltaproteobacteria bacterium]
MYLSEIAEHLSSVQELTAWEVTQLKRRESQLYTIFQDVENIREVTSEEFQVRIYLTYERNAQSFMGESSFVLTGDDLLRPKIKSALEMTRLIANQPFSLPEPGSAYPAVKTFDAKVASDPAYFLEQIHGELITFSYPGIELSSSEIFMAESTYTLLNSTGLRASREETEIMLDFVFLAKNKDKEGEIECLKRCRLYDDLKLAPTLSQYAAYARDMLTAELPSTGLYDVIFAEEALDTFFNYFIAQAGGQAAYQGWSQFKENEPILSNTKGERLTLISDPSLPGSMKSKSFDENGLAPEKVLVIENNIFRNRTANKRYADYLGIKPTGNFANVVVSPGDYSLKELMSPAPVLHLLKFSTFEPNPVTGAFSGEIRVGYLIDGDKRVPIKGGSISGTMSKAMQEIYFSQETTKRESYSGPLAIKVCNVNVAGR